MNDLKDRIAVVTGAASGIGEALAQGLAARGAQLVLADVDDARLQAVAQSLRDRGARCVAQRVDVSRAEDWQALADRVQAEFGGADVLFNNAGVAVVAPVDSVAIDDAQWLMGINFWGVMHGCRAFAPQLRARPGRAVVNISSIFAMISAPGNGIYNASKAAVRALSDALREEWRDDGVQVLCVHPGGIRTAIARSARLGDISMVAPSAQALHTMFDRMAPTSPERAAQVILDALLAGRSRVLVGNDARFCDLVYRLVPWRASAWITALGRRRRDRLAREGALG